jgi:hypothetical protein
MAQSGADDAQQSPTKKNVALAKQKLPPPKLQLQLEIEAYQRVLKKLEKERKNASDDALISIAWNEVHTRQVLYDTLVGTRYIPPPDVASRAEKQALVKLFYAFHGHAWARNNGWIGQPKILKKPEVLLFEAEASLYEGLDLTDVSTGQKAMNVITTVKLEGTS